MSKLTPQEPDNATKVLPEALGARPRLDSLDWLRGLVMVLMVLDHARDFLAPGGYNPRDIHAPALFLTRWVTHLCAPTFVFVAGVSAYLYGARGRTRAEVSRFLVTRGLWLILLETTLVRFAWTFSFRFEVVLLQVIWAIGVSLVCLSGLIYLPRRWIAGVGLAMIAGHNLLDGFNPHSAGLAAGLWMILHQPGILNPGASVGVLVVYPLIPWIGVMAAGYAFGPVMQHSLPARRRQTLALASGLLCFFVILRASNLYGDPQRWEPQPSALATLLAFLNCEKYPPSLLFLSMTLGIAMCLLSFAGEGKSRLARVIIVFGRVPFFFYIAHLFVLHAIAAGWAQFDTGDSGWLFRGLPPAAKPPGYGFSLPIIFLLWISTVALLYPPCRWFGDVKQRSRNRWLSYL